MTLKIGNIYSNLRLEGTHKDQQVQLPDVQPELPLMQLHSISSCPDAGRQRGEISAFPSLVRREQIPVSLPF